MTDILAQFAVAHATFVNWQVVEVAPQVKVWYSAGKTKGIPRCLT